MVSVDSPQKKVCRKFSKFLQTPETHIKCNDINQDIGAIYQDFTKFMNNNISDIEDSEDEDKVDENLERLTKDLIQVFSLGNLDKSSTNQKKNLLKRVLKLGGEDYSFEDLRKYIMSIEEEDSIQRQV